MQSDLTLTASLVIAGTELAERFSRSSGPGGQGVNTTDSRVELSLDVARSRSLPATLRERALSRLSNRLVAGVLTVVASEHRSQRANRLAARARLVTLLRAAIAAPAPKRRPTRPSRAAKERRLRDKHIRAARLRKRPGHDD